MSVKVGNAERTIPFSFPELAATLAWRYPNPFASHIQSTDYIERPQIGDNGELLLNTLTFKSNPLPQIFKTYATIFSKKACEFVKKLMFFFKLSFRPCRNKSAKSYSN